MRRADSPDHAWNIPVTWSVTTAFDIHLMYASADPQENDVPLYIQYWSWNGQGGDSDDGQTISGTPDAGVSGPSSLHPTWNDVLSLRHY